MTVKELKELLENEPDDKIIVRHGYEGEYDDIRGVSNIEVLLNGNTNVWYYGCHVERSEKIKLQPGQEFTQVLLIA